jgi:hypothetical protein
MASSGLPKIAIVWRGDRDARQTATQQNNRFYRIFEELEHAGMTAERLHSPISVGPKRCCAHHRLRSLGNRLSRPVSS